MPTTHCSGVAASWWRAGSARAARRAADRDVEPMTGWRGSLPSHWQQPCRCVALHMLPGASQAESYKQGRLRGLPPSLSRILPASALPACVGRRCYPAPAFSTILSQHRRALCARILGARPGTLAACSRKWPVAAPRISSQGLLLSVRHRVQHVR